MQQTYVLPWNRPEALGISPAAISAFLETAHTRRIGLHSFMLLRKGQVAAEAWWSPYGPERPHMLFSLSKSFTSTAVGLAVAEGWLSVDDRVVSFFPDKHVIEDRHLKSMCVRHLLTMSTGHDKDITGKLRNNKDRDWVQSFLETPVEHEPGTRFVYNSAASYMLSAIVQKVTGQTLLGYLQPRLFEALDIRGAAWESCPRGIHVGGWGLSLKTDDIARFGQLYLQKGKWNGVQVVPENWVNEATSLQIPTLNGGAPDGNDWKQGYGYQFWRSRHGAYRGDGAFGQYCIVMPDKEAVIAITSGVKNMQEVLNLVWEHLLPGMSDEPLALDDGQYATLEGFIASLAYEPLGSDTVPADSESISGKRYVFDDNEHKLTAASIRLEGDGCTITFWNNQGEQQIRCGIGRWMEGTIRRQGRPEVVAASGRWLDAATLEMEWRYVGTPFTEAVSCRFEDDLVNLVIVRHAGGSSETFSAQGKLG